MQKSLRVLLLLFLMLGLESVGVASENYVTKERLTKKDVYPYTEEMVSRSGGRLLTVYRVVNQEGKALVFLRYHNRYGPTRSEQLILNRDKETGRRYDSLRHNYLLKDGVVEE